MELTREQIKEGNDKLAKLMGWYQDSDGHLTDVWFENSEFAKYVAYSYHNNYPYRDLPFHRDWNYLMKVVDKIGCLVYRTETITEWKRDYSYMELYRNIFQKWLNAFDKGGIDFNLMNSIETVWIACVAYMDWYNTREIEDFD